MKSQRWNEDELKLTKQRYNVNRFNTISLAEQQRLIALSLATKEAVASGRMRNREDLINALEESTLP